MTVVLSEHLPLLATAPNGIQKLRGLILELAVRGQLVPQDPDDEPASELLKRIAKERARLEVEGVCKKSKPMPLVDENEQPFALPSTWAWTRLGEITNFGQTDKDGDIRDTTWVLDLEDIEKDTSVLLRKVRFAERQAKSDKNRFQEGDVLYGKLRPYLNKVIVADEGGVCTTEILPVRGYHGLFPRYLMHAVKRPDFLAYVNSKSYGMKMPRLGTEDGRLALFPLPPMQEQQRIVAKVDELMALCDRLEAEQTDAEAAHAKLVETLLGTLAQSADAAELAANWQRLAGHFDTLFTTEASLDTLKQTILQLAVMGKLVPQDPNDEPASKLLRRIGNRAAEGGTHDFPFAIPRGWEIAQLSQLLVPEKDISYGVIKLGTEPASGGVWTLRCSDVKPGHLDLSSVRRVSEEIECEYRRTRLSGGEIVLNIRGTLGGVAIVPGKLAGYNVAREVAVIPVSQHLVTQYLLFVMLSPYFWQTTLDELRGIAYKGLNLGSLRGFDIPVPPLAEQHRIVAKVDELMALCNRLKADLAELRTRQARLSATLIEAALQAA